MKALSLGARGALLLSLSITCAACAAKDDGGLDREGSELRIDVIPVDDFGGDNRVMLALRDEREQDNVFDEYEVRPEQGVGGAIISFTISAPKGAPALMTVVLTGTREGLQARSQTKAIVAFVPGRRASLRLPMGHCGDECGRGKTCAESGGCEATPLRETQLEE
jgi:hypothetical protein